MANLEQIIRKHALKNALDFGNPSAGAVAGKVIGEFADAKNDMKITMAKINAVIAEISNMDKFAMESELKQYSFAEKPKEERKGFELPNAEQSKVITRFPPEPSGYPHIGHAKAAFIDYLAAKQYTGKMILRFDDTNPEKETQEYVAAIKYGLIWLGISWEKETYTSDNMEDIYSYAEKLISKGKAYVCTCTQVLISELRTKMKPCECREIPKEKIFERWEHMLSGKYKVGTAVLRFKGDLSSLNTVMRDPALARIISFSHYRQGKKYVVWPGYDLAVVVMDNMEGITHPMRTKEYELRDELYLSLCNVLEFKKPILVGFSRLEIKNAPISKRLITPLVKEKKVLGWDDPRLPTLAGLKRRGILPEAIKNFVVSFGLSKVESEPGWDKLLAENRKLLDPLANHYFFVPDPVKLKVKGLKLDVKLKLHPRIERGYREYQVKNFVFISKSDADSLAEGELFALKDLCVVKVIRKGEIFEGEVVEMHELPSKKIQWVSDKLSCEILLPKDLLDDSGNFNQNSLEKLKGYCEKACENIKDDEIMQFERFGYCRLDRRAKGKLTFIFSC